MGFFQLLLILVVLFSHLFEVRSKIVSYQDEGHFIKRIKRSTCEQKFSVISGHTACLSTSSSVQESGVSSAEKKLIVSTHNNYRSVVSPTAADMTKMSWDDEVALIAQKWAENCQTAHDQGYKRFIPGRLQTGQNLAWGTGKMTWDQAIKLWYDEVKDFTYGGNNVLQQVGHYTQVVWAKSSKIGCGYAQCGSTYYYVCNYSPPGNFDINNPYTSGTSCAQCSGNCNNNLCDCGELVCLNGGTLNLNTCTCSCKNYPHYVGSNCALNCSLLSENQLCGSGTVYIKSNCPIYSNVPFDCPGTCDVCPYGGIDYSQQSGTTTSMSTATPSTSSTATPSTSSTATSTTPTTDTSSISLTDTTTSTLLTTTTSSSRSTSSSKTTTSTQSPTATSTQSSTATSTQSSTATSTTPTTDTSSTSLTETTSSTSLTTTTSLVRSTDTTLSAISSTSSNASTTSIGNGSENPGITHTFIVINSVISFMCGYHLYHQ